MKDKKILAFDIDGTLLNDNGKMHEETKTALKIAKEDGFILTLCSGRGIADQRRVQVESGNIFDFMICNNGAYFVEGPTEKQHTFNSVSKDVVLKALELAKTYKPTFALHTNTGTYRNQDFYDGIAPEWYSKPVSDEWKRIPQTRYYSMQELEEIMDKDIIMQAAFRADEEIAHKLAEDVLLPLSNEADIHIAGGLYVDMNPVGTDKFVGLQRLCDYLGTSTENIFAFGDSGNDIAMLKNVGYGICMGSGTPKAKAVAKEVIGSNNDKDAIAKKIYEILAQ